jgi:hypothetical protein
MVLVPATLLVTLVAGSGPMYIGTERQLKVAVPRIETSVTVDGRFDEPVWQQAAQLTGFSEYAPDDGRPAEQPTEVLVWYSPTAIHFGIRAHASAGSVRATLANRDRIQNDDWVQIYLETFADGRQATVFGVNPLGVQLDGAVVEGSTESRGGGFGGLAGGREEPDLSPDFVFDSKGRLTDFGYEVEVRIPFKTLRYQSTNPQDWGIHIIRRVQSTGHEDSWTPARRSAASFLGQAGTLVGLTDIRRGLVMDLNPVVTARTDGLPAERGWRYDASKPEFGANVRWGATPNVTVNATINPDFSQVESDATQFAIDPRLALFFPEKRPFFLDGIEFFSTPNSLVYTRRIVAPIAATKVTGKIAGTTIAALSAVDDASTSIDGDAHPVFNIARVQRDFGGASHAGVLYTDRLDGAHANHVASADGRIVWRKIYALNAQLAVSETSGAGDRTVGPLWYASFNRNGRRFGFRYSIAGFSPDFQTAAGFIGRRDIAHANLVDQITLYGKAGARIEKWTGDVTLDGVWRYEDFARGGPLLERKLHLNSNAYLRGGWHTGFSLLIERYGYDPRLYTNYALLDNGQLRPFTGTAVLPNLDYVITLDTPRVGGLSANALFIWGRDENFFEWANANIIYAQLALQWRPTERFRIDVNEWLQSYQRRTDNSYAGIGRISRVKIEYQATRAIFFRAVGEYASNYQATLRDDSRTDLPIVIVASDGTFTPASSFDRHVFRNDWLFSYQPTPGTLVFAGYGAALTNADDRPATPLRRTRDGFFLKVSYLFRL